MYKLNQNSKLYNRISDLLILARSKVKQSVDSTMTKTYFEIGRLIVEEEQSGKDRAEYGKLLISKLSKRLTQEFGRGFSSTNLKQMRTFYLIYSKGQTLSDEFRLS